MTVFLGIRSSSFSEIEVPYMFEWEHGTPLHCIRPHLAVRAKSHEFSRVTACTWGIFTSYGGDGHLKLGFVQRSQDSCLVMTDTSLRKTRLGRTIRTLLEVRREAMCPILVGTVILLFLSIFTKSQASSPFEALN